MMVMLTKAASGEDFLAAVVTKWHDKSWIVDGCAKIGERQLDQEVSKHHTAPVRCCSFHDSSSKGSCSSKEMGCKKQTYSDAKQTCADFGMRMCSWHEMKTNLCCGSGCNFDLELAWVLRESYGKLPSEFDPDLSDNRQAWAVDGCAKAGDRKLDKELDWNQVAAVRCCSDSHLPSCQSKEIGCLKQTYSEASNTCAKHGQRLCSWHEMKTNFCCGTGCNFDLELVWVLRESYGNPHWPNAIVLSEADNNETALV